MSYITIEQLTSRFGAPALVALTDRGTRSSGRIDTAAVAQAIADTVAVIDGYVRARYALPFDPIPPLLSDLAGQIVFYKLHTTSAPEKVTADYKQALAHLNEISSGVISLPKTESTED